MGKLAWYWHRLAAMSPGEMLRHARKKLRQRADSRRSSWPVVPLDQPGAYPKLPRPEDAPEALRAALRRDADDLLAGRWRAFTHLELRVDDPPQWHKDYLVGLDLATDASAFALNHRALPGGADIKLIWELSRWQHLTRLAMAAYVLADARAAAKCVAWLEDWVKHNPPYRGWNWTSALEVGMRLIQFTWIDALLGGNAERGTRNAELENRLAALRQSILPTHVWYTWRHKSFGSSANNHLLGELAGLILATVRWPELAKLGAPLEELQRRLEHEVLAQFADDGGNKEQALNYQLFSWELCWHARNALVAAGRQLPAKVNERLDLAARFFWEVQYKREPWDYGDSDNAFGLPCFVSERTTILEWHEWIGDRLPGGGIDYWIGRSPVVHPPLASRNPVGAIETLEWWRFPSSGIAIREAGFWFLRFDLSPLGYLATAAHGHQDVLHLSFWYRGVAVVVDPGTGAYYADQPLRAWLASRDAHNGATLRAAELPSRLGPFLWSSDHRCPEFSMADGGVEAVLKTRSAVTRRFVSEFRDNGWEVIDSVQSGAASEEFTVRWQFPPGALVKRRGARSFVISRNDVEIQVEASEGWGEVELVESVVERKRVDAEYPLAGTVSSAFRKVEWAPYLKLVSRPQPGRTCVFRTTFLASPRS
jgi:hypothetical protein